MPTAELDLPLVARYALLVSLTHLIPVPLLDAWIANTLRARLTRLQLDAHDWRPPGREVRLIGGATAGGCLGILWSLILWPIKKALRLMLWFLLVKSMVDTFSDVVARAVLVDEALQAGLLPGDSVEARAAIQRASRGVSVKPIERGVALILGTTRRELWRWLRVARDRMRSDARKERHDSDVGPEDGNPLAATLESVVLTLAQAIWIPEVHEQLRAALRREIAEIEGARITGLNDPT